MYTVTIEYRKPVSEAVMRAVAPICRIMVPTSSYIDTAVYTQGGPVGAEDLAYGKSIYATNVNGWGEITLPFPYDADLFPYPVPLAQFSVAMVGEEILEDDVVVGHKVEFDVDDYKEAFYYIEVGSQLKDEGFTVTVVKN